MYIHRELTPSSRQRVEALQAEMKKKNSQSSKSLSKKPWVLMVQLTSWMRNKVFP